jgi:hypothetical protein
MKLFFNILEKCLTDSRAYILVLVGAVLLLPSVFTGLAADDYFLSSIMLQRHIVPDLPESPFDAFVFLQHEDSDMRQWIERGILPWWTNPQIRIAFWRPLSAVTHWLDFSIFPDAPWLMHVHNLIWYGALCMIVLVFYRRFFIAYWRGPFPAARIVYVAGLAALLYAADDARGLGVGWISNRNAIISAVFAITSLLLYDRWQQQGWFPGAFLAPVCLGLGLLGGESALAIFGYFFAYELFISRGSLLSRLFHLIPEMAVVVLWRIVYSWLGYGTSGTGLYLDPAQSPMLFFGSLVQRLPILLLGQLGMPNSALWTIVPGFWPLAIFVFSLLFLAFTAWMLWPLLRRDRLSRFLALGMVLAAIPSCATYPNDRLLFFTGIGGMGLVVQYIALARQSLKSDTAMFLDRPRAAAGMLFSIWVAVHMVLGPVLLPFDAGLSRIIQQPIDRGAATLPDPEKGQIIMVHLPMDMMQPYIFLTRFSRDTAASVDLQILSAGLTAVEIEGVDAHTVIIRPQEGLFSEPWDRAFRDDSLPLSPGDRVKQNGMTAQVTKTNANGRPAEIRYSFEAALDDPQLQWVTWSRRGFVPFRPPVPGERILLEKPSLLWWL